MGKKKPEPKTLAQDVDLCVRLSEMTEKVERAVRKAMAPKGGLGLPPLLDQRRLQYGIPNGAFDVMPTYDTCYVAQLSRLDAPTFAKEGKILRPDLSAAQEKNESPRGVLVGCGLLARDALFSNGIGLGHVVRLLRLSPYCMWVDNIEGHDFTVLVLHAGDIKGSEDTMRLLRKGALEIRTIKERVNGIELDRHVYVETKTGRRWTPQSPWMPDDY